MTVKRVIFIRPGETDWNRHERWQGWVEVPLNAHGRQQAQALANFVRNIGVGSLYASDLKRAAETANLIGERLGYAPIYDERLRERGIGAWQGLTLNEIRDWYPDDYAQLIDNPNGYRVPGGESLDDVKKRMHAVFDKILAEAKGETVGIVSHTTAIRALLADMIEEYKPAEIQLGNTSVTTIQRDGDRWKIVASNDIMHLEGLESRTIRELED